MDLLVRFEQYIQANRLCEKGQDRILLAVSGGKDSALMLHLFAVSGYRFGIAHCNFRLRGTESDQDEKLVREYAEKWDVPVYVNQFDTREYADQHGISIQMAARDLRYAWFEELRIQEQYDLIAVAHHAGDQVETVLINLLRGTGIRGMQGMLPIRGAVIRPLLEFSADEVAAGVAALGLAYRDDASNFSPDYLRNKLRLEVVPLLKEINPGIEQTFAHNARLMQEVSDWMDEQVNAVRENCFFSDGSSLQVNLDTLRKLSAKRLLVYELFRPYGFTAAVCSDLSNTLEIPGHQVSGLVFYSCSHVLRLDRNTGHLFPLQSDKLEFQEGEIQISYVVPEETQSGIVGAMACGSAFETAGEASIRPDRIFIDAGQVSLPLQIRTWQAGDTFQPLGMGGRHKKLSDLFVSLKIPRWKKEHIPVVTDAGGEIIWVVPYRQSERYKILPHTKNVMTLSYLCKDGR